MSSSSSLSMTLKSAFPGLQSAPSFQAQLATFLVSFVALALAYRVLAGFSVFGTAPRQLSWIITTIASLTMTLASLPFVWDYVVERGSVRDVKTMAGLAVTASRFFQAYLSADLSMGSLFYRSQINLLTGWFHHILYIGIVEYAIRHGWAHVFCLAACMEFPTFILGFATLIPRVRSNILFAVSFFLTRILFHIVLCITYYLPKNRPLTPLAQSASVGSVMPAVLLTCVFPMHVSWFLGCLKGFKKRAKARKEAEAHAQASVVPVISFEIYSAASAAKIDSEALKRKSAPAIVLTTAPARRILDSVSGHVRSRVLQRRTPFELAHAPYAYDHYAHHYFTRYAHYSSRYAHYRARLRGLKGSVAESMSQRFPALKAIPAPLNVPPIVKEVKATLSTSIPTRENLYLSVGLGKRGSKNQLHQGSSTAAVQS